MSKKPVLKIIGTDGNAFAILAKTRKAAQKAGWDHLKIDAFMAEAKAGDYNELLRVCSNYFEVK